MTTNERKLVRGSSIFGRKSVRRNTADPPARNDIRVAQTPVEPRFDKGKGRETAPPAEDDGAPGLQWSNSSQSISLIPERMQDVPGWYQRETERASLNVIQLRRRYPLHNPFGPRWYKNHHLIPPHRRQGIRPSSVFSPSFPPISFANGTRGDHPQHTVSMPGPSRSPSGSPVATPNSSQVRVNEAGLPAGRARKVSHGEAHDHVDLMDISDPWGKQWHHQSPYDVGMNSSDRQRSPVGQESGDSQNTQDSRSRLPSTQNRHKTVTPSPLSQSTSAVHLHAAPEEQAMVPRKLSKRRKTNPFGSDPMDTTKSAPVTPIGDSLLSPDVPPATTRSESRTRGRISLRPSASTSSVPATASLATPSTTSKKEKRGSILGRIAKKFSMMRKPAAPVQSFEPVRRERTATPPADPVPTPSPERPESEGDVADISERPLSIHMAEAPRASESSEISEGDVLTVLPARERSQRQAVDRSSMSILEAPFTMGRLTVANPDSPSSNEGTPVKASLPIVSPASSTAALPRPSFEQQLAATPPPPVLAAVAKDLPPEPAPSVAPSRGFEDDDYFETPMPPFARNWQPGSPAFSAQTAFTIPDGAPSELAYLASPSPPPHDELPTIPSPSWSAVPLPPTDLRGNRMTRYSLSDGPVPSAPAPAPWVSPPNSEANPMARASMLVEPPTPYSHPAAISPSPIPTPAPSEAAPPPPTKRNTSPIKRVAPPPMTPAKDIPPPMRDGSRSPTKSNGRSREGSGAADGAPASPTRPGASAVRRTETFRLVRSPSGGVLTGALEMIGPDGEHWNVVEEADAKRVSRKERSRSKGELIPEAATVIEEASVIASAAATVATAVPFPPAAPAPAAPAPMPPQSSPEKKRESRRKDREHDRDRERDREREREKEREREREKDRERERDREKERERERERERDKPRDRDRDRDRDRRRLSRDHERERERERDRHRDHDRTRDKERDREREREREREKEKEREREREREKEKERVVEVDIFATNGRRESRRRDKERDDRDRDSGSNGKHESRRRDKRRSEDEVATRKSAGNPTYANGDVRVNGHAYSPDGHSASPHSQIKAPERRASQSTRPTSELPSTADQSSLKARDAYELERMWKGRSVAYESTTIVTPPPAQAPLPGLHGVTAHIVGNGAAMVPPGIAMLQGHQLPSGAAHGSAHTAYTLQNPLYHTPRAVPQPTAQPQVHTNGKAPSRSHTRRTSVDPAPERPSSNPLPDPPRQSTYKSKHPHPLTPPAATETPPISREYWSQRAGLTVTGAH